MTTPPMSGDTSLEDAINGALNRMKRAHERRTGCHLTAQMIEGLGITFLAETWSDPERALATPTSDIKDNPDD